MTKSKPEMQTVQNESSPYKYFTMMLNMAEDDLNPHEYRLLAHYVRWAGHGGVHKESVRAIAKTTRMGKTTIDKTRDKLEAKGYIKVTKPTEDERKEGVPTQVIIVDRWAENINRYAKGVPNQVHGVDPNKDTGVPNEVQGGVPKQVDSEEPKNEEPLEKQNTPLPPRDVFADFVETLPVDDTPEPPNHVSDERSSILLLNDYLDVTQSVDKNMLRNNDRKAEALRLIDKGITKEHIAVFIKRNKTEDGYWKGKNVPWSILIKDIVNHFEIRPLHTPPKVKTPVIPASPELTQAERDELAAMVQSVRPDWEKVGGR